MKILKFIILPVLVVLCFAFYKPFIKSDKNQVLEQVIMQALSEGHFQPQEVNDKFSEKIFKLYLDRVDFSKKFLLKEDIAKLNVYKDKIDDELKAGTFEFFELSNTLLDQRIKDCESLYKEILAKPFDFNTEESIETEPKKLDYPAGKAEQKEAWRKYLKYQTLLKLNDIMDSQEKAKDRKDSAYVEKNFTQMEEEARGKVLKANDDFFHRMNQLEKSDRLSVFLNSIANIYDPHTEFFPPKDKANFDIAMSGHFQGIGASLQEKDGYIKVAEIVPGSASWRQGQLKAGDLILKVAQGNAEPVDVTDMRIDKVVEMIRGKKGTEVKLTVKKVNGSIVVISLIRDEVVLEESYAKSALIGSDHSIGYIKLPSFYADFNRTGGRNSSSDIRDEVAKLKNEKVSGIIIDLRDNGGGSLQDVVDMAGLFIEKGPIVQVKTRTESPTLLEDRDPAVQYDGPLVIMVNNFSASASEILAAAMQDYKRAVIIGSNSTFGKGTVQRFVSLDDLVPSAYSDVRPLGSLKITTQKFYRINGSSTQLKGVTPDIILPDIYSAVDNGEKDQDFPLPWDEIGSAKYNTWKSSMDIDKLRKDSKERVSRNPSFALISEQAERLKKQSDKSLYTHNLKAFRLEQAKLKEDAKKYENIDKDLEGMDAKSLTEHLKIAESDSVKKAVTSNWFKKIKKDVYLQEAAAILKEIK